MRGPYPADKPQQWAQAGIRSRPAAGLGELRPGAAKAEGSLGAASIVEAEAPATQKLIEAKPLPQPDWCHSWESGRFKLGWGNARSALYV